ncbi:MAG: response regulator [Lachnospiraceae bacterium]|nr:response regulator [Lachnospiraceae bacterium]
MDIFNPSSTSLDDLVFDYEEEKKVILVVDDNATTLRGIKAILEKKYDVILANSGTKAIAQISRKKPDLILLDYEMPVCDGKQTFEMIRSDEEMADIPVVFVTGVNDKSHIHAVLRLKPAGYMLKPYEPEKLLATVEKVLGGANGTEQ